MLKKLYRLLVAISINPKTIMASLRGWPSFRRDLKEIRKQLKSNSDFQISFLYPILRERHESNGDLTSHYFHEDLWAARKIFQNNPIRHVDVGSRVDGLVAHVATFREIEVFDIRPQVLKVRNIEFITTDFMNVPATLHNYTDSLSSMNVIEHFGLGRYDDPIDINGHLKGLEAMHKVLKPGGKFYFSTPMGPQRIEFNAHRVFDLKYLLNIFNPNYVINEFSYVDDKGLMHENVELTAERVANNCGCQLGFAIFEMTKR